MERAWPHRASGQLTGIDEFRAAAAS